MIADQANELRDLVRRHDVERAGRAPATAPRPVHVAEPPPLHRQARLARSIAVTSGKGGVGKTTVSVNLAVALARLGQRVVLLDADLGTANADVLLNLPPSRGIADVIAGRIGIEEAMVAAPGGFQLIPGASGLAQVADLDDAGRQRLLRQLGMLRGDHDVLLIDTGAGVSANVLGFVAAADEAIVVTTPEPTAITDAYALIKTASRHRDDLAVRLVVNMTENAREAGDVAERVTAACERFLGLKPSLLGHLPRDPRVSLAVRERRPLLLARGQTPAGRAIERLAAALLAGDPAAQPPATGLTGFLTRLTRRR